MNDSTSRVLIAVLASLLALLPACGGGEADASGSGPSSAAASASHGVAAALPADLFVVTAPSGAVGVGDAVQTAQVGQDVVVRGVIGGRKKAFVDGRAMLVVADAQLEPCAPDEGCPTPWDFCCEAPETLRANTMIVQVVNANGAPIEATLEGVHGLDELKTIVVAGTVRNADGSLVVDATQVHVVGG